MTSPAHTLLVVDDDPDILEVLRLMLEGEGYRVQTASTGQQMQHLLQVSQPDLVLLDFLLSGTDGRVLVRQLQSQPSTASIPILMFSAHPLAQEEAQLMGVDGFIAKPFEMDDVLAAVAAALAGRKKEFL